MCVQRYVRWSLWIWPPGATTPIDIIVDGDGAARRRRERRFFFFFERAFPRYVQWTVAVDLATVRHHSNHKVAKPGVPAATQTATYAAPSPVVVYIVCPVHASLQIHGICEQT